MGDAEGRHAVRPEFPYSCQCGAHFASEVELRGHLDELAPEGSSPVTLVGGSLHRTVSAGRNWSDVRVAVQEVLREFFGDHPPPQLRVHVDVSASSLTAAGEVVRYSAEVTARW